MWVKIEFRLIGGKRNWHCKKCRVRPQSAVTAIYIWHMHMVIRVRLIWTRAIRFVGILLRIKIVITQNACKYLSVDFDTFWKSSEEKNNNKQNPIRIYYNLAAVYIIYNMTNFVHSKRALAYTRSIGTCIFSEIITPYRLVFSF